MTMTTRQRLTRQPAIRSTRAVHAANLDEQRKVGIHQTFAQIARAIDAQTSALHQTTETLHEGFAKQDALSSSLNRIAEALKRSPFSLLPHEHEPLSEDQKDCLRAIQSAEQVFLDKFPCDVAERTPLNNQALEDLANSRLSAEAITLFQRIERTEWSQIIEALDETDQARAHRLWLCHALRSAVMSDSRLADSFNNVPAQQT